MDLVAGPQGSGKSTFFPVANRGHDFFNVDERRRALTHYRYSDVSIDVRNGRVFFDRDTLFPFLPAAGVTVEF